MRSLIAGVLLLWCLTPAASAHGEAGLTCGTCPMLSRNLPVIPCPTGVVAVCGPVAVPWEGFVLPTGDCPDQTKFIIGAQLGVHMTILTPGVYWASNLTSLNLYAFQSQTAACNAWANIDPGYPPANLVEGVDYQLGQFTKILYKSEATIFNPAGIPYLGTECSGWDGKYKALCIDEFNLDPNLNGFFTIPGENPGDPNWLGFSFWVIQIPDIRVDTDEVPVAGFDGKKAQIKIELTEAGAGGLCTGSCRIVCSTTVDVAWICSATPPSQVGADTVLLLNDN